MVSIADGISLARITYDLSLEATWLSWLSEEETSRLATMKHEKRRHSFLLGRAVLRGQLSELTNRAPKDIRIVVEENGSLSAPDTGMFVSIAHSGARAVAVASKDRVGVDIEWATEKTENLLAYILHENEYPILENRGLTISEKLFLCWTAKESILKALETGLRRSPKSIQVVDINERLSMLRVKDTEGLVWEVQTERDGDYYLAIARAV
jgi:phosphopantetheinyl transferase